MFYIPTSTALASFSDYISTQMAEGKDEGNNHPVSSAVYGDALPSHLTNLTVLQENKFSLQYRACLSSRLCYKKFER